MGKLLKGAIGVGASAALLVAGNLAPNVFEKEEKEPTAHVVIDAKAIAKSCGNTALADELAADVDPSLTAGQLETNAQKGVRERMTACYNQFVTEAVAAVLEDADVPQVDVDVSLVTATTSAENKG